MMDTLLTTKKRFVRCPYDHKSFRQPSNLIRHILKEHSSNEIRAFKRIMEWKRRNWNNIIRAKNEYSWFRLSHPNFYKMNSETKLFDCSRCEKSYSKVGALTRHFWDKHSTTLFTCPDCFVKVKYHKIKLHDSKEHDFKNISAREMSAIKVFNIEPNSELSNHPYTLSAEKELWHKDATYLSWREILFSPQTERVGFNEANFFV